ncbi:transcription factor AP-1-like isoform X2 [Penaeus monodon]|uniref:transcription factor AP-1-like isoform X2 n=1 Tax=Penaeus monodon TaxID=6687 RepID=UPI0018A74CF1|nr:transcription factor AP-1-like isoform X2 [Penaeus monodon]
MIMPNQVVREDLRANYQKLRYQTAIRFFSEGRHHDILPQHDATSTMTQSSLAAEFVRRASPPLAVRRRKMSASVARRRHHIAATGYPSPAIRRSWAVEMNFQDLVTGIEAHWAEDRNPVLQRGKGQTKPLDPMRTELPRTHQTTKLHSGIQPGIVQMGMAETDRMFPGGLKTEPTENSTSGVPESASPHSGLGSLPSTPASSSPVFYYSDISPLASFDASLFEPSAASEVSFKSSPVSSDESSSYTIFIPVSLASPSSPGATAGASGQDSAVGPARRFRRGNRRRTQPYKLNDSFVFWEDAKGEDEDTLDAEWAQDDNKGPAPPVEATASTSGHAGNSSRDEDVAMKEKYLRIRSLNNAASKRCRKRKLEKIKVMENEEKVLVQKNQEMKKTLNMLQKLKAKLNVEIGKIFKQAM